MTLAESRAYLAEEKARLYMQHQLLFSLKERNLSRKQWLLRELHRKRERDSSVLSKGNFDCIKEKIMNKSKSVNELSRIYVKHHQEYSSRMEDAGEQLSLAIWALLGAGWMS